MEQTTKGSVFNAVTVSQWLAIPFILVLSGLITLGRADTFGDYVYTTNGASITITGYTGPGGNVTIPDTILDKQVTTIASSAFANNTNLTSVTIPNSVTNIGRGDWNGAFSYCSALTNVALPNSLVYLNANSFEHCTNLTDIIIPDSVNYIGDGAFDGCTGLTLITIPNSVVSLREFSFSGCTGLRNLNVPDGVRSIMFYAFIGCTGLTNIFISKSVTVIEDNAFFACDRLETFTVDEANTRYAGLEGVLFNKNQSILVRCPSSRSGVYVIPNGVTTIAKSAFDFCGNLTNITIPNSLTAIGGNAFWWCTNLTSIYFEGDAPTSVPTNIFYKATNVTVYYRAGTTGWSNTFAGQPTALWTPTYQEWARIVGLTDQFPNASGEGDDADHDGMSNLAEMQAGTDPMNANSKLAFESVTRPEDLIDADKTPIGEDQHALYFQSAPGRQYEIQSANAFGGIWQAETNVTATTTQKRVLVKKPIDQGFYRVVLVP